MYRYISNLTHAEHLLSTSLGDGTWTLCHSCEDPLAFSTAEACLPTVWALHYSFPNPVSPRVFVELQLYRLMDSSLENGHQRSALVITLPFDIEEDEELKAKRGNNIIGKYVSVERITEIQGDRVEWRYVTPTSYQINTYGRSPCEEWRPARRLEGLFLVFSANSPFQARLRKLVPCLFLHKQNRHLQYLGCPSSHSLARAKCEGWIPCLRDECVKSESGGPVRSLSLHYIVNAQVTLISTLSAEPFK